MTVSDIAQQRERRSRMAGTKGHGRDNPVFPPFVFAHDHQAGNAVKVARAPVHVRATVADAVRLRRIAVDG
jgi:hypothetical protein